MSNIKIYYHQFHIQEYEKSPFSLDGVGFDPEMVYNSSFKNSVYFECPAWKHKATRTFLIRSPVDIHLVVDNQKQGMYSTNLDNKKLNLYCSGTFVPGWCTPEKTTIQLSIPRILFWTKNKNIWVESKAHPLTSVKNNLICVPGWYNMSNWIRPISASFDVVDPNKPIIINRGDVLFEVSFYSKNLDDGIILKKDIPPKKLIDKMDQMSEVKRHIRNFSRKFLFKNKESKCPFHFMWK
jgi:hypothetical protein